MIEKRLLIIEGEPGLLKQIRCAMDGVAVSRAGNGADAERLLRRLQPQVVILDLGPPSDPGGVQMGLELLASISTLLPATKVIVVADPDGRPYVLHAVDRGAYDVCQKPVDTDTLRRAVDRAFRFWELEQELRELPGNAGAMPMEGLVAASEAMMDTVRQARRVATSEATVLIHGEPGTGRKLLASRIHDLGPRSCKPFVAIGCATGEQALLERELFGGVDPEGRQQSGRIQGAHGGTVLLEEIGDLPIRLQVKLLKLLEDGKLEPAGGARAVEVDVRIIATVSMELEVLVDARRFLKPLAVRLAELTLVVPPLRDRGGDATQIARYLLDRHGAGRRPGLSKDCITAIENWHWPGNVRELENRIKRGCVLAQGRFLVPRDLGFEDDVEETPINLKEVRSRAEREAAIRALQRSGGNVSQAARLLGISRPTLYNLMSKHDLLAEANHG